MLFFNYTTIVDPFLRDIRRFLPEFSDIKAGEKILDVCCGTGDQVFYYEKQGFLAFGIDSDEKMISYARGDKRNKIAKNVFFHIADAKNLPFKDGFFDSASISLALHEKESCARDKVISEMKRVVRRGGELIFADFRIPLPRNFYSLLAKTAERSAGGKHFECFKDYTKQGGLEKLLEKNNLKIEKREFLKGKSIEIIKAKNI